MHDDIGTTALAAPGAAGGVGAEVSLSTATLVLRPIGYWCLAWVWLAIWLITVLIAPGTVAYVYFDDEIILGEVLADTPVFGYVMLVLVLVPILAAIMGPAATFYLPTMTWPLALLCFVYAFRGLRPSYARERLSHTTQAPRGSTLGPPTIGTVALSLKPNRRSGLTDTLMKWYMAGWSLEMPTFFAALPAGVGWVLMFVWASRDIAEPVRVGCLVAAAVLVLVSVVLVARALRADFRRWTPEALVGVDGDLSPSTGVRGCG